MKELLVFLSCICLAACTEADKKVLSRQKYEGPDIEMDSITLLHSDSGRAKVRLKALKQLVMNNDDREYPAGIYLEFFDRRQKVTSKLSADKGFFDKKKNLYKAEGNVELLSLTDGSTLSTQELFWNPDRQEIYSNKFYTLIEDSEAHTGVGFITDESFDVFQANKGSGTVDIE